MLSFIISDNFINLKLQLIRAYHGYLPEILREVIFHRNISAIFLLSKEKVYKLLIYRLYSVFVAEEGFRSPIFV